MPTDSLLVAVWGDLQTRSKDEVDSSHGKRRAF